MRIPIDKSGCVPVGIKAVTCPLPRAGNECLKYDILVPIERINSSNHVIQASPVLEKRTSSAIRKLSPDNLLLSSVSISVWMVSIKEIFRTEGGAKKLGKLRNLLELHFWLDCFCFA